MKTNSILTTIVLTTTLAATTAITHAAAPSIPTVPAASAAPEAPTVPEVAPASMVNPMPTPNQVVYLPQLPSPAALVNVGAAQGLSVEQINQTSTQITVVYKYPNGQTNTICYALLQTAGVAPVPAGAAPVVVPVQTTVVYERPAPAYYYDPFYYPWPWFAPVAIDLGFGFRGGYYHGGGFHGGGFHGGYHGWR